MTGSRISTVVEVGHESVLLALPDDLQPGGENAGLAAFELAALRHVLDHPAALLTEGAAWRAVQALVPSSTERLRIAGLLHEPESGVGWESLTRRLRLGIESLAAQAPAPVVPAGRTTTEGRVLLGGRHYRVGVPPEVDGLPGLATMLESALMPGAEAAEDIAGILADMVSGLPPAAGMLSLLLLSDEDAADVEMRITNPADPLCADEAVAVLRSALAALAHLQARVDLIGEAIDAIGGRPSVVVHVMGKPYTAVYPADMERLAGIVGTLNPILATLSMGGRRQSDQLSALVGMAAPLVLSSSAIRELQERVASKVDACSVVDVAKAVVKAQRKLDAFPPPDDDPEPDPSDIPLDMWTECTADGEYVMVVRWLGEQRPVDRRQAAAMSAAVSEVGARAEYLAAVANQMARVGLSLDLIMATLADLLGGMAPVDDAALLPFRLRPNAKRRAAGLRAAGVWDATVMMLGPDGDEHGTTTVTSAEKLAADMLRLSAMTVLDAGYLVLLRKLLKGKTGDADARARNMVAELGDFYPRVMDPEGADADHAAAAFTKVHARFVAEAAARRSKGDPRQGWVA